MKKSFDEFNDFVFLKEGDGGLKKQNICPALSFNVPYNEK